VPCPGAAVVQHYAIIDAMTTQPGVLALGTTDHVYLELDLTARSDAARVLGSVAGLTEDLSTTSGVNAVIGLRPSLWQSLADPALVPSGATDWREDLVGPDGFTMPATQHDVWLWISAGNRTAAFDTGRVALERLRDLMVVRRETTGWLYRNDRDLTGFIDGTENPPALEAPSVVAVPDGQPGAGSTAVLFQLWRHDSDRWTAEPVETRERAMGRKMSDSMELQDKPPDSHVARTDQDELGQIFRRNVAYGDIADHGTVFVGFSYDQSRLTEMLRRMAGLSDGIRCALTRYVAPFTGAYYVVPSVEALAAHVAVEHRQEAGTSNGPPQT
jgi:putative iron-dependent peroxidase